MCAADGSCAFALHQINCCGTLAAVGFNVSENETFAAAEDACRASYPRCRCLAGPTMTDSGEIASDISVVQVGCITQGPAKYCRTYVTMRPPDVP
jgi:hypothetical protein